MFLFALLMAAPDLGKRAQDAARIEQLIEQLGSPVFAEREAATRELERVGEPALEPLIRASQYADDLEIRRRAERLIAMPRAIQARALTIRKSRLSPEEKAKQLKPFLSPGMTSEQVCRILGQPITVVLHLSGSCTCYYSECGLTIDYRSDSKAEAIR